MDTSNLLPQTLSPTAYQIGQYGRTPVSYFHGLPQISVPLTEVRGRGITIPVSLNYHGGGIKAEQHPGWVGLGWSLQAGGCVTRVVNGIKDEMSASEYEHLHGVRPGSDPGYLFHASEIQDGTEWTRTVLYDRLRSGFSEYEPDEYILSAPGLSCSFILLSDHELRVISRDSSPISLEEVHTSCDGGNASLDMYPGQVTGNVHGPVAAKRYRYIDRIVLRDSQGNRYVFGGDTDAIEYSVVQRPTLTGSKSSPVNAGNWDAVATANTWMLTRIERADGETVIFSYERNGVPIVLRDVHHGCVYASDGGPSVGWFNTYYGVLGNSEDTNDIRSDIYRQNLCFSFLMPCYLSEIRCLVSGDRLAFETDDTTERGYDYTESLFTTYCANLSSNYSNGPFTYAQFRANDRYRKLVRIHGTCRDVRLDYTDDTQTRLKLTGVRILGGTATGTGESQMEWSFAYDPTPLPGYNSRRTDRWGYYNGTSYEGYIGNFGHGMDAARVPAAEMMKAEILTEIRYPTGGWTEYLWEPHSYGMSVLPPGFEPDTQDAGTAGGLRIASIIDHVSDVDAITRTFSYEAGGTPSGVLCARSTCESSGAYTIQTDVLDYSGHFAMYSEQPILPLSETDGCHVTYSCVRETFADGGYAEYHFSNHDVTQYRDHTPEVPPVTSSDVSPLYPRFTSRALQRGLLLRKEVFRADGVLMSREEMSYADSSGQTYRSAALDRYVGGNLVFLSYSLEPCGYPALTGRTVTEYKDDGTVVSDVHERTYNSHRLPVSGTVRRGSVSEGRMTIYACDRSGGMYAQMVSDGFTGLPVGELKLRDGKVVATQEMSYKDMEIPSFEGSRRTWRPAKLWTGRFASPVAPGTYNISPMSYMESTPDVEVKLFDGTSAPLFAGMKDGSATEWHWDPRHGLPGMVLKTKDMDFQDDLVREQHDIVIGRPLVAEGSFRTTRASTLTCSLSPQYGYAWRLLVAVDGVSREIVFWNRSDVPDEHWMDLLDSHDSMASMNIDAGDHNFRVTYLELDGPGGSYGTTGGYVSLNYCQAVDTVSAGAFLSLDEEDGTSEGFLCEHGHSGPLTVQHDIITGMSYVLDYMERQTDGEWHYVRTSYSGGNVAIGTAGMTLSNVRIYPEGSMPESYSCRDFVGMTARTDVRGVSESYAYDSLGRLSEVRDNDGILGKEHSCLFATAAGGTGTDNVAGTTEYNYTSAGTAVPRTMMRHLDGLGRPVQEVLVDGGGTGCDIITRKEYDGVGRELRTYIPSPSDAALAPADTAPYSENEYETSPRDRILSVTGPGQAWHDSGKKMVTGIFTNVSSEGAAEFRHQGFTVEQTGSGMVLRRNGTLTAQGMLDVTKTIDEDGDAILVFKDVHGEEVLTRRLLTGSAGSVTFADTHTVRDSFGRVAAVIPPKLTAQLETSGISGWNYSAIEDLAFLYRYDSRGNCIAKNVPGGGWTYMAYDKGGRCVFTQDAVQREEGRWAFRLVDIFGSECVTGTVVRDMNVLSDPVAGTSIYVSLPASPAYGGTLKGYVLNGLTSLGSDVKILTVNYHDGYGFNAGDSSMTYTAPSSSETYGRQSQLTATGLLTGRLVRVLDGENSETFIREVMYYDDRGRIVQKVTRNGFGKVDREYMAYDFAGNVTKRKVVHGKPGTTSTFTETLTYTFDAMGRPLKTTHKAGSATSRTVVKRSYDPVGRLASLCRINPPVAALTQTYSYNIRSWLTGIGGSLFSEELDYNSGDSPRWDGKISAIRWKNPSETAWRSYGYTYDSLSRLTDAEYDESGRSGAFSEHYAYDLNGNMRTKSAARPEASTAGTEVIALSIHPYSYTGNRMSSSILDQLTYDACGRLTGSSGGHVRSIEYNEIGLPKEIQTSDGIIVSTVYAADGRKLSETVTTGSTVTTRHYSGSCIFEGATLKKVLFEGGYAQMSGSTPTYMFFLTDHLGSVRVVANQSGTVLQTNQYSPFGDLINDANVAEVASDNRYRFTGKERSAETLLHDFGARYLDSSIGRFTTIDPLAEKYPAISPYAYCCNNPVQFVDVTGCFPLKPRGFLNYYSVAKALENSTGNNRARELGYAMQHPIIALRVGDAVDGGTKNLSSIASNFATNIYNVTKSVNDNDSNKNAIRHVLWQSMLTQHFGIQHATRIGNSHEVSNEVDPNKTSYDNIDEADRVVDLLNNFIGRDIGATNPKMSNQDLAKRVVEEFFENGLWTYEKTNDGKYLIHKTVINAGQKNRALDEISKKNQYGLNR